MNADFVVRNKAVMRVAEAAPKTMKSNVACSRVALIWTVEMVRHAPIT
jgi:hypothetical protein